MLYSYLGAIIVKTIEDTKFSNIFIFLKGCFSTLVQM